MDKNFAVFFDCDNISSKYYEPVLRKISSTYGQILEIQACADWTIPNMKTWKYVVKEPVIRCQQSHGINATDTRVVIEATKLMILNTNVNAFCIVSTDADFHVLAQDLRANGKYVIGIGKEIANSIWKDACDVFITLESLNCEETGVLLGDPKYYGFIKSEHGVFYFSYIDVDGDINDMVEGAQVIFKVLKEPDPTQQEKYKQRGKATNVRLVA